MKNNPSFLMLWASFSSIGVAFILILLKVWAFFVTGSVAILSTLFDSIQDLMTSTINLIAVKHSIQPADKQHRFGHGKAQGIGSLIQSLIILVSGFFLIYTSLQHFFKNTYPSEIFCGVWIISIALILTFILVCFQKYVVKITKSLSIQSDMVHYTGDILMNLGVLISLICSYFIKTGWIDVLFGVGVGIYLIKVSYYIICQAIEMLMDTELPSEIRHKIKENVLSIKDIHQITDLKTRQSGNKIFIQMTLHMTETLTLKSAHQLADQAEYLIHTDFPNSEIVIHLEPESTSTIK